MRYILCHWIQEDLDEPVKIYSEVDEEGHELRKVEVYRDGTADYATQEVAVGQAGLALILFPSIEEINMDSETVAEEISPAEFKNIWKKYVG
ncbi:hypothetical protein SAMN06264849_110101 [Melghirimyces algeriensis]|uniref:DUF6881 domain-containing protein n=2 Tax=Melghirimyces algeriensis TaxID=910412 RepID=A0A521ESS8_9BACL|nr:hypothetical protein SAMN06264849_110101 [Melghirimyces algeriensis]